MTDLRRNRLLELLADEAIFGLSEEEVMELEQLKKEFPEWKEDFSLELTAAAINLSDLDVSEEMPSSLRTKIFANADEFFKEKIQETSNTVAPIQKAVSATAMVETEPSRPIWQWLGWAVAAAACIALVVNIWITRKPTEIVQNPPPIQTPTPKLSVEQERAQLLSTASDVMKIPLTDPKNVKDILGEMVWSNALQKGYVRFSHLPINDAAKETYQLWIVDAEQPAKNQAINGGVFNISKNGEVIIPVDPQVVVKKPTAIAVTAEKPGGVVVSAQEKVVALAKV